LNELTLRVNGQNHKVAVDDPDTPLLYALRDDLRLRGIADHSALPGQGTTVGKTLHRIEESMLRQEIEAAGFRVVAEGNFWRSPDDTHDFPSYRPTTPVDNFVLKFQKPM
jgi:hypothetical protein